MSRAIDWRDEYRSLADQQEAEAMSHAEIETLLCRAIVRITLAADGLDAKLDPYFRQLRNAVKKGVDPSLKAHIDDLSDSLLRAQDPTNARVDGPGDVLERLLNRFRPSAEDASRYSQLSSRLLSEPAAVSDDDIDVVITLFTGPAGKQPAADPPPGFLGRLFVRGTNAGKKTGDPADHPNDVLLKLLERLNWPGQICRRITELRDRLVGRPGGSEWVGVISELVTCVSETLGEVQSEIRDTEGFLNQLTERLRLIDRHVRGNQVEQKASLDSGRELNQTVSAQVSGIGASMREARDMKQLRGAINKRLDVIQEHVQIHLNNEEGRFQRSEDRNRELTERLAALEAETNTLRSRIVDVHHKALYDIVTDLPNRLGYEERVAQEFIRWKRFAEPLVLAVWDIDDFKKINDRFGHQAGDKALRVIARTLKQRLRESDFVGRYGGEEFVMLLPGAPPPDAGRIADEMRKAVETAGFHAGSKSVSMTISCGISEFRPDDSPETVFRRADKALYEAKRLGKNRCVIR